MTFDSPKAAIVELAVISQLKKEQEKLPDYKKKQYFDDYVALHPEFDSETLDSMSAGQLNDLQQRATSQGYAKESLANGHTQQLLTDFAKPDKLAEISKPYTEIQDKLSPAYAAKVAACVANMKGKIKNSGVHVVPEMSGLLAGQCSSGQLPTERGGRQ